MSKFVNDYSTNNLIHDHFYDEQIAEVDQNVQKSDGLEVICQFIVIIEPYETGISFKPDTESKHEAVI